MNHTIRKNRKNIFFWEKKNLRFKKNLDYYFFFGDRNSIFKLKKLFFPLNLIKLMFIYLFILKFLTWIFCFNLNLTRHFKKC